MPNAESFLADWPLIDRIEGWLAPPAAALMDSLLSAQDALQVAAQGMLEIGTWKGRSAALMARHLRPDEELLLVDAWLKADAIGQGIGMLFQDRPQPGRIKLLQGESLSLGKHLAPDRMYRYIHIDGEHTAAALRNDLVLACRHLAPGGLIVVDDVFNALYPQLTRELFTFLAQEGRDMACLLIGFNKACLCRTKIMDSYGDWVFRHINAAMDQRGTKVSLCRTTDRVEWPGYSLVPDQGKAHRGPDYQEDYLRP
jgi:hypothetical protein